MSALTGVCGARFDTVMAFIRHLPRCLRCAYAYAQPPRKP